MRTLREIALALRSWHIWWTFAVDDVVGRYRRTIFGPLWLILAQAGFIGGLFLLHGVVYNDAKTVSARDLLLFLAVSLPLWNMMSYNIVEGALSLTRAKSFIEAYPLPMPIHMIRSVVASIVTFAHVILVYVVAAIVTRAPVGPAMIAVIPGFLILVLFGFGCTLTLSSIGARFRDISPALGTVLSLLFVLTPVFWVPAPQQVGSPMVQFNPFYHLLEVCRKPLLSEWPALRSWAIAGGVSLLSLLVGAFVYGRERTSIIYWL